MTDKRFINDIDNGKLIDTKGELSTLYYSDSVDFFELWEFLNKLNDENEQLKYNLSAHMVDLNNYKGKCSALEIENEQLKQKIKELQGKASSWKITASEQIMEQSKLVKENKQLKKEIEQLHQKIFEMRTNIALERTEISRQTYTGKKNEKEYLTAKEFLDEIEKW